jgi:NADH-quinone oxidoreductase subunit N
MTGTDLIALLPLIVLAASAVGIMLVIAFARSHSLVAGLSLGALALAILMLPVARSEAPRQATPLILVDRYALLYMGLLFAATFAVAGFSYTYLEPRPGQHEEFYVLLLLAALGGGVLVAASHFASFFLGLEVLSVSLYGLIAHVRTERRSIEAGIKYLTLAAASAAFLLFGMALIYADRGSMAFDDLISGPGSSSSSVLWLAGFGLLVVGLGFKLAVVPFHMWVPDVYEGAPAPVAAFVATVSKGAVFALLLRLSLKADIHNSDALVYLFEIVAIASMFAGNFLALLQSNVKRILAYSSIAHLGYLLTAFLASGDRAVAAATFYLVAYFVTTLGAFGVIGLVSGPDGEADAVDDYRGLYWRRPWLAAAFTGTLFSLAGIPLTAGFIGKFYVLTASVGSDLWLLSIVLVATSGIGLYYYLRIIVAMFLQPQSELPAAHVAAPVAGSLILGLLTLAVVWLGVYPAPVIDAIQGVMDKFV